MSADQAEPRCYGHEFDLAHHSGPHAVSREGQPAHVWTAGRGNQQGCRYCRRSFENGDRYVCVKGGVMHVACVADLDDSLMTPVEDGDR